MGKRNGRHPLKMPLRTDPVTHRIICRFHNYDATWGCKKHNDRNNTDGSKRFGSCELDHETCHVCLQKGHPAHQCQHLDDPRSEVWKEFCSLTLENTRPADYPSHKTVLGDPIVWIGDAVPPTDNIQDANRGDNTQAKTVRVAPPSIPGFEIGVNDQLLRCKRQKKVEAAFLLRLGHGAVVVDAGAHLGDTVLTLAVHARAQNRRDLRFLAIEPCPEKCDFIESVIAANNLLGTVRVRCAAVGDTIGVVRPESSAKERATRDGSLRYECYKSEEHNGIPMITLDSIFDEVSPLGMLHLDVEGWEPKALRGAKRSLTTLPVHDKGDDCFPCVVVAEAWTEKESLRRGVSGNAEESIARVMEHELYDGIDGECRFERAEDIVDIERNLVYVRKKKKKTELGTGANDAV